jgi:hypothetical protein
MLAKQMLCHLIHSTRALPFAPLLCVVCVCIFKIGSQTVCLGWLRTVILLISVYRVARITGVSHGCLTPRVIFKSKYGHMVSLPHSEPIRDFLLYSDAAHKPCTVCGEACVVWDSDLARDSTVLLVVLYCSV